MLDSDCEREYEHFVKSKKYYPFTMQILGEPYRINADLRTLRRLTIVAIIFQASLLLIRMVELVLINVDLILLAIPYAAMSAVKIFLYWEIRCQKNWARLLWVVVFVCSLFFVPNRIIDALGLWAVQSPRSLAVLRAVAQVGSIAYSVFLTIYLLTPKAQKLFVQRPISLNVPVLLGIAAFIAILFSRQVSLWWYQKNLWSRLPVFHQASRRLVEEVYSVKHREAEQDIGMQLPTWGDQITSGKLDNVRYVTLRDWNTDQVIIIFISPSKHQTPIDEIMRISKDWFMPEAIAPIQLVLNGKHLEAERVRFPHLNSKARGVRISLEKNGHALVAIGLTLKTNFDQREFIEFLNRLFDS